MANSRTKPKPWIDLQRISAALAVANRPKGGRRPEYEIDDELEPKPFERQLRIKRGAR